MSLRYSTHGLLDRIKTWNEESGTGVVGLGWEMQVPAITRIGNGSIHDSFYLDGAALLLRARTGDATNGYTLDFELASAGPTRIRYETAPERWTVVDVDGVTSIFGGDPQAIEYAVRWISQDGQSPRVWIGASVETGNQRPYALRWNLASRTNVCGQRILYSYEKVETNLGLGGAGSLYTAATYLTRIEVVDGEALSLHYAEKEVWEYPADRTRREPDGTRSNAFQDRVETRYLTGVDVLDAAGVVQRTVALAYDFLYKNMVWLTDPAAVGMRKRVLTAIAEKTPEGVASRPPTEFDYWGLSGITDDYDREHKPNVGFFSIYNGHVLDLGNADLLRQYWLPGNTSDAPDFGALFGHLCSIKRPTGAVTWYSYNEVSASYKQVWNDGSWETYWQNKLDLGEISPPGDKWTNPQPSWGADNFVVIRWDRSDKKQVYITLYEWIGRWVEVFPWGGGDSPAFDVADTGDDFVKLVTGLGAFVLVRTDCASGPGAIALFNRDPHLPGRWTVSYFVKDAQISSGHYTGGNYAAVAQVGLGRRIAGVFDRVAGAFYLYTLGADGVWRAYSDPPVALPPVTQVTSTTMFVGQEHVFVTSADNDNNFYYWLYHDDPLLGLVNKKSREQWPGHGLFDGRKDPRNDIIYDTYLSAGKGFLLLFAHLVAFSDLYRTMTISWDDEMTEVNLQPIYTILYGEKKWGVDDEYNGFDPRGWADASDLIDITWNGNKQILRFIGGSGADGASNRGWNLDTSFINVGDNADEWVRMATLDTTVDVDKASGHYHYRLWQFDPLTESWVQQDVEMGSNSDWSNVIQTVDMLLQIVSLMLSAAGELGELGAAGLGLGRVLRTTDFIANGPGSLASGLIQSAIVKDLVAGRRDGAASGMKYLMVGTGGVQKYSGGGQQKYDGWQPFAYSRQWDRDNHRWTWRSVGGFDPNDPEGNLARRAVDIPWRDSQWDDVLVSLLGQDIYNYFNYFTPFSYVGFGTRKWDGAGYYDVYWRGFYFDQVAFFRNGVTLGAVRLPTWSAPVFKHYDRGADLPYLIFNRDDDKRSRALMFAPWGGTLGYRPWINTLYGLDVFKHDDFAWESDSNSVPQAPEQSATAATRPRLATAKGLVLLMARDEAITGSVLDYVVDQVTVDDGYQRYRSFYQYLPHDAYFQSSRNTVLYNRAKVALGGDSFQDAAARSGWTEHFFYTGKPNFDPVHNGFAFDPAAADNAYVRQFQDRTNVGQYLNLVLGQEYCRQVSRSRGGGDFTDGYEMSRRYMFHKGFERADDLPPGSVPARGCLVTLRADFTAADDAALASVVDGYEGAGGVVLEQTDLYYDLAGFDDPFLPGGSGKETALPAGQTVYGVDLQGRVQAAHTSLTRGYQITQSREYARFWELNLLSPVVQSVTRANMDLGRATWEASASVVVTWRSDPDGCWRPDTHYRWRGTTTPVTGPLDFPAWDGRSAAPDWVASGHPTRVEAGIVLASVDAMTAYDARQKAVVATPRSALYDVDRRFTFAEFQNADAYQGTALYAGFETYEDLDTWVAYYPSGTSGIGAFLTSDDSYTGQLCLALAPPAGDSQVNVMWSFDRLAPAATLPGRVLFSFFYRSAGAPAGSLTASLVLIGQPTEPSQSFVVGPAADWTYAAFIVSLDDLVRDKLRPTDPVRIALSLKVGADAPFLVDDVALLPIGASMAITVTDPATWLPAATIDANGYTLRTIRDARRRAIATVGGRGKGSGSRQVLALSAASYSRDWSGADTFAADRPNEALSLAPRGGGHLFDFRVDGDTQGWQGGVAGGQALRLQPGHRSSLALPSAVAPGFGLRVQFDHAPDYAPYIGVGPIGVEWSSGSYLLSRGGVPVTGATGPEASDWLVFYLAGTFYFYADGRQVFALALDAAPTGEFLLWNKASDDPLVSRDIMTFLEPVVTTQYTDGLGDPRQSQSLAEVGPDGQAGVVVAETLYHADGAIALRTVPVVKGAGAAHPGALGFEAGLVAQRDPLGGGSLWDPTSNQMTGQIDAWVDERFKAPDNTRYAYRGTYRESDPLRRPVRSTASDRDFVYDGSHALQHLSGRLPDPAGRKILESLGIDPRQLGTRYHAAATVRPLNDTDRAADARVVDPLGRASLRLAVDLRDPTGGASLLSSRQSVIGASAEGGAPTMRVEVTRAPDSYASQPSFTPTTRKYDALGRLIYARTPDAGIERRLHDDAGNPRFSQDAEDARYGRVRYRVHDSLGRLVELGVFSPPEVAGGWDARALASYLDADPAALPGKLALRRFRYDPAALTAENNVARLVAIANRTAAAAPDEAPPVEFEESLRYDERGRVVETVEAFGPETGVNTRYGRDNLGNIIAIGYALGGQWVYYGYNLQGLLGTIGRWPGDDYYASYRYGPDEVPIEERSAAGAAVRSFTYDALGELTGIHETFAGASVFQEVLQYRADDDRGAYVDGNVVRATFSFFGQQAPDQQDHAYDYRYDAFGRLTAATATLADGTPKPQWSFAEAAPGRGYDANGNFAEVEVTGATAVYGYQPGSNRVTRVDGGPAAGQYLYDENGWTRRTPRFDADAVYDLTTGLPFELVSGGQRICLSYGGKGERVEKKIEDGDSRYRYGIRYYRGAGTAVLTELYDWGTHGTVLTYVQGLRGIVAVNDGARDYFVSADHLGSARRIVDGDGALVAHYNYDALGMFQTGNHDDDRIPGGFRYLFTGQEWDGELGLYNSHARQYHPTLGRFLTPDPAHQYANAYSYAGDNPVDRVDPDGRVVQVFKTWGGLWRIDVTPFGPAKTIEFGTESDYLQVGTETRITFRPNWRAPAGVKIGLIQVVGTTENGRSIHTDDFNLRVLARHEGPGAIHTAIDRINARNPVYGALDTTTDSLTDGLPSDRDDSWGSRDARGKLRPALLYDAPRRDTTLDVVTRAQLVTGSQTFETAAMVLEGQDAGKFLGSIRWGWTYDRNGVGVKLIRPSVAGEERPTSSFYDAVRAWNSARMASGVPNVQIPHWGGRWGSDPL